ncbi:MAG: type IV secretory system conjugative DNA transfer family protein [Cyclobacteriaceae bacterium]
MDISGWGTIEFVLVVIAILVLIGFLIFLIFGLLHTIYSIVRTKMPHGAMILGRRKHYALDNVIYRQKDVIQQEWIYNPQRDHKKLQELEYLKRSNEINAAKQYAKELNDIGLREDGGYCMYSGKVSFLLSSEKETKQDRFGIDEYERYKSLFLKSKTTSPTNHFGTMLRSAWDRAYSRRNLYADIKGISKDEIEELYTLINRKLNHARKQGKETLTPWEDFYLHAYDYRQGKKMRNHDYEYEYEMENMRNSLVDSEKNPQRVLGNKGVHVGQGFYYPDQGNFLTIGGTRSGKGVNLIIPQLLNHEAYNGSVVSIDVKGTLTAITAKSAHEKGHKVIILDPWGLQQKIKADHNLTTATYNPFDILTEGDDLMDDCDMLAEMLVPIKTGVSDQHWEDRARQWVSAYILYMACHVDKIERTVPYLRSLFKRGEDRRNELLYFMLDKGANTEIKENGEEIKGMFDGTAKEANTILSVILRELDVFKSPALTRNMAQSSFDIQCITNEKTYLYVVIPAERLNSHTKWLRLILASIMTTVLRHKNKPVLLLMDEFYSLGYMNIVAKSMGLMPEYNLQLWAIVQNLEQLKEHYPKNWETFIANSAVTTWLGIKDNFTSDHLARLMGTKHIKYKSNAILRNELSNGQTLDCEKQEIPVQSALQIRENFNGIYALVNGLKPMNLDKAPYYEDEELSKNASPNPIYEKGLEIQKAV